MIENVMFIALGFTAASLLALLIAPAAWRRAVRLTTRKVEATMPVSVADIKADKDLLRGEYAIEMRRLELALEKAKERAARHLIERNQHMVEVGKLEAEIADLKNTVAERDHANSILEQTVRKHLPDLESQLKEARETILARERELAERARAFENQTEALELAQKMIRGQEQEIDRLRGTLEAGLGERMRLWGKGAGDDAEKAALAKETGRLNAELSQLREDLTRLKDIDAADAAELRTEMHRLADLMLAGTPAAKPKARARRAGARAPAQAKQEKAPPRKKPAAAKSSRTRRTSSARKGLTRRLDRLKGKKQKEDA